MAACREELTVTPSRMAAGEYWVVESGAVRGFVCLAGDAEGDTAEIDAMFVDPAFQRQGVGRMLWRKVLERARSRGVAVLYLDADPSAVPFYEAMGFAVVGEAPSGSLNGRMLPRMELRLDARNRPASPSLRKS